VFFRVIRVFGNNTQSSGFIMDIMLERVSELIGPKHGATKELAEAIGVSANLITDWKSGLAKSYTKYAPQIAEYYGVSLDWLSGLTDEKEKPAIIKDSGLEAKKQLMLRLFDMVPPESQEMVIGMIEAALKSQGLL
jgi:transcriptional regulator with XRE-family HTH domain